MSPIRGFLSGGFPAESWIPSGVVGYSLPDEDSHFTRSTKLRSAQTMSIRPVTTNSWADERTNDKIYFVSKKNRNILVCKKCRAYLARGESSGKFKTIECFKLERGRFWKVNDIVDEYSEPLVEELLGWYIFHPLDVEPAIGFAGDRCFCPNNHLVGMRESEFLGNISVVAFDPIKSVFVGPDSYVLYAQQFQNPLPG